MSDWIPWNRVFEPVPDKTAVDLPVSTKIPERKFEPVQGKQYNIDYDEDVNNVLNFLENNPQKINEFISIMEAIRQKAANDNEAYNLYEAVQNALDKKDPLGLRAAGRVEAIPKNENLRPDFDADAVEGIDNVDKTWSYEGLLSRNRRLYPDY